MIKEFDTMFPRCLFLAKNTNYKEIVAKFKIYFPNTENEITYDERHFNENIFAEGIEATVYLAQDKKNKNFSLTK